MMKKLSADLIYKALSLIMAAAMIFGGLPVFAACASDVQQAQSSKITEQDDIAVMSVPYVLYSYDDLHNPGMGGEYVINDASLTSEQESVNRSIIHYTASVPVKQNGRNDSQSRLLSGLPFAGIIVMALLVVAVLWALVPRKNDELIPIEEYRRKDVR